MTTSHRVGKGCANCATLRAGKPRAGRRRQHRRRSGKRRELMTSRTRVSAGLARGAGGGALSRANLHDPAARPL